MRDGPCRNGEFRDEGAGCALLGVEPLGDELIVGGGDELRPCFGFPLLAVVDCKEGRAWKPFILMVNTFTVLRDLLRCQFLGITIFTLQVLCPQGPAAPGPGFYSAALAFVEDPEGQLARLHLCLTPSLLTCVCQARPRHFPSGDAFPSICNSICNLLKQIRSPFIFF